MRRIQSKLIYLLQVMRLVLFTGNFLYILKSFMIDRIKPIGRVHILLREKSGIIKYTDWVPNLVVNTGRAHIADQMADQGEPNMSYMAIGEGTTGHTYDDTALENEINRKTLGSKAQGTGQDGNKVTFMCEWPAGEGTGSITEAGIFNSPSAGTMLCRTVFPVKNKGAGDSLTLTWVLTLSS